MSYSCIVKLCVQFRNRMSEESERCFFVLLLCPSNLIALEYIFNGSNVINSVVSDTIIMQSTKKGKGEQS